MARGSNIRRTPARAGESRGSSKAPALALSPADLTQPHHGLTQRQQNAAGKRHYEAELRDWPLSKRQALYLTLQPLTQALESSLIAEAKLRGGMQFSVREMDGEACSGYYIYPGGTERAPMPDHWCVARAFCILHGIDDEQFWEVLSGVFSSLPEGTWNKLAFTALNEARERAMKDYERGIANENGECEIERTPSREWGIRQSPPTIHIQPAESPAEAIDLTDSEIMPEMSKGD